MTDIRWTIVDSRTGQRVTLATYISKPQAEGALTVWPHRDPRLLHLEPCRLTDITPRRAI